MRLSFDVSKVVEVDLCLALEEGSEERHVKIPVDETVKNILMSMLTTTVAQIWDREEELEQFEISEKYGPKQRLFARHNDECQKIKELFSGENWIIDRRAADRSADLTYYFAVYRDHTGRKLVGARRASQFKAILSQQNRLLRWLDDTLTVMPGPIFRLDNDFDFLIDKDGAFILRPHNFEFVADVESLAADKARDKARSIGQKINFIDFASIADFASRNRRAARLVAAIYIRNDLHKIQREKLISAAFEGGVELKEVGDKLTPAEGNELALLEVLDHRRYSTSLTDDEPSAFVASSRQLVKGR